MNREIKRLLRENQELLLGSKQDLKAIYTIMFHKPELVLCEGNDGFQIYRHTYGQIQERICQAANALYARLGSNHQYVALEMENGPEWIVAFWAILMSGNKPYLVNTRYPQSLTEGILKTLKVRYVVCQENSCLSLEKIPVDSLKGQYPDVPEDVFEDELAFSSSATSMKEVICFYHGKQIAQQILNFRSIVKENPRMTKHYKGSLKQLAFLPFYHVFGLFAVYFWFTFFGRTLVFLRDYSADTILKTCRRHEVTHIFAVPMLWHTVEKKLAATVRDLPEKKQKALERGMRLSVKLQNLLPGVGPEIAKWLLRQVCDQIFGRSVMFCINGGSYLRDSAMELFNAIGYSMHNGYGMSEIGITSVELRRKPVYRNQNTIGRPFDSVEYRLDEKGILQVRGSSLCVKKLINGEPAQLDAWFDTGDRMECRDGYYTILGRQGDTVIGENGENINPDMVEKLFVTSSFALVSVLGLPGENGQELCLVAQISPFASQHTVNALKEELYAINATLPSASAVKKFYFTQQELMDANAVKVSRRQLQKRIADGAITLIPFGQFRVVEAGEGELSPLMLEVRRIVAKVLDVEENTIAADAHLFFDLGATSIQYFSILTELAQHFSLENYQKDTTYRYTLREMTEYIERYM